jgi:peptidoglycan-N-acetylglucosamine deacetylase
LLSIPTIRYSYAATFTGSCNCVAFRLDDIQDYFLDNVQVELIKTFENKNASLTIGIIGNHFGDDLYLVSFLKEKIGDNNYSKDNNTIGSKPTLEIANHGWNHEDFSILTKDEQSDLIDKSNDKIFEKLGVTPSVFIPPFNSINNDTVSAVLKSGIRYVSANATNDSSGGSYANNDTNTSDRLYHFPSTTATGDLNDNNTKWQGVSHEKTFSDIENSLKERGFVVVTMHPQEYSIRNGLNYHNEVDQEQIHELELLLDEIQNSGLRIVPISQISDYIMVPEFNEDVALSVILVTPLAASIIYRNRLFFYGSTR